MWNYISVVLPVGTEVGVVEDKDGKLVIATKLSGQDWTHGIQPIGGNNTIGEGCTRFSIVETENE